MRRGGGSLPEDAGCEATEVVGIRRSGKFAGVSVSRFTKAQSWYTAIVIRQLAPQPARRSSMINETPRDPR